MPSCTLRTFSPTLFSPWLPLAPWAFSQGPFPRVPVGTVPTHLPPLWLPTSQSYPEISLLGYSAPHPRNQITLEGQAVSFIHTEFPKKNLEKRLKYSSHSETTPASRGQQCYTVKPRCCHGNMLSHDPGRGFQRKVNPKSDSGAFTRTRHSQLTAQTSAGTRWRRVSSCGTGPSGSFSSPLKATCTVSATGSKRKATSGCCVHVQWALTGTRPHVGRSSRLHAPHKHLLGLLQ